MDVIEQHGYLRAAISAVGRGTIGAWWSIAEHPLFRGKGSESERNKLYDFYSSRRRKWDNIKDYQNIAYKLVAGAMYLKYFGQCAFYIVRSKTGKPIGLDFLPGVVIPNVDEKGYFKTPAFYQYIDRSGKAKQEFSNDEIVFISNPDFRGDPMGGSDVESLTQFSLPTDLYLMTAAREYIKNRDKPEAIYELPSDITDEAFDEFADMIANRYRGPSGMGRSPVVVSGELNIKELSKMPTDLPFAESRNVSRNEIMAASGSNSVKIGLSDAFEADTRELRYEFLEGTLIPLFKMMELAFYEQIHVKEFGIREWEFKFDHPDFLTAVEQATVHMRYRDMGVLNANEIRSDLGYPSYSGGDEFVDVTTPKKTPQGSPPEGREDDPDKPSNTGEPTLDDQDPPRGDQHDDAGRRREVSTNLDKQALVDELYQWKDFVVKRTKKGLKIREFVTEVIPDNINYIINQYILSSEQSRSVEDLKKYFDEIITFVKEH